MSAKSGRLGSGTGSVPLVRESLASLRLRAVRRGCWFSCLKQGERRLLDLTISVVKRVRSFMLAKIVSQLVRKLCEAMESRIYRLIRTEGRMIAKKLSTIADAWGYLAARSWASDCGFMQFLVVTNLGVLGK